MSHTQMYAHTLIIGGTGMLRTASIQLAGQSRQLTSVARTARSLNELDSALPAPHGMHYMLALDWSEPLAFLEGVRRHVASTEQPDLVVAWIHDTRLGVRLAATFDKRNVEFFHVIGSAGANVADMAAQARRDARLPGNVAYHQVILGAIHRGAHTRWLTHNEISAGVVAAVQARQPRFLVGTLEHG